MKQFIATGWTVNDSDLDSRLIGHFNNSPEQTTQTKSDQWNHSSASTNSSALVTHYKSNDITLMLCGRPTIKNDEDDSFKTIKTEQQLSALVQAYKNHGYHFLRKLNGSFSIALFDSRNHITILAIDRMGIEQMHYANISGHLYFSSSLKSLSNLPGVTKNILPQSIYNYFYFHCIPSPNTIYQDLYKLKPAEVLIFKNGSSSKDTYWTPEFNEKVSTSVEELKSDVRKSLDSTMRELSADANTGSFLSGGTDSSTLSGLMKKHHPTDAPAFSIGFEEQGYDEMGFADIAVKKFQNKHYKYYVNFDDVLHLFNEIPKIYEEPFGNSSVVPTFAAAQLAKKNGVDHMIGGDGGDEIFGGNDRYATQKLFNIYSSIPKWARDIIIEPSFCNSLAGSLPIAKKVKSYIEQAKVSMPKRMQTYNILHVHQTNSIFDSNYLGEINCDYPLDLISETYNEMQDASLLNKMLYLDWKFTLADNDIRKVNTMCRAAGVEVSYPFLDNRVVESSTKVPSHLMIQGMRLRAFYKDTYSSLLPPEIITKSKHGFGLPFGVWLKKDPRLQDEVYGALTNLKTRSIFQDKFIDELIKKHRSEHAAYYGTFVWVLAVLERWLDAQ
jgi:asparagine synthase (glutamine-hydrolysing)